MRFLKLLGGNFAEMKCTCLGGFLLRGKMEKWKNGVTIERRISL